MLRVSIIIDCCKVLLFVGVLANAAGCGNDPDGAPQPVDLAQAALQWNSGSKQWDAAGLTLLERGRRLYGERCAGCHQRTGSGSASIGAPALQGSAVAKGSADIMIRTVLFSRATMPPFRNSLSDEEHAMILSYVRNAWGNDMYTLVEAPEVAAIRLAGRM